MVRGVQNRTVWIQSAGGALEASDCWQLVQILRIRITVCIHLELWIILIFAMRIRFLDGTSISASLKKELSILRGLLLNINTSLDKYLLDCILMLFLARWIILRLEIARSRYSCLFACLVRFLRWCLLIFTSICYCSTGWGCCSLVPRVVVIIWLNILMLDQILACSFISQCFGCLRMSICLKRDYHQ